MTPTQTLTVGVRIVTDQLTDQELAKLYLLAQFSLVIPPSFAAYERIAPLLTQHEGTALHPEVVEILGRIVNERLPASRSAQ